MPICVRKTSPSNTFMRRVLPLSVALVLVSGLSAFQCLPVNLLSRSASDGRLFSSPASNTDASSIQQTKDAVGKLKTVLEREYVSFFDPMQKEYYAPDVSFDDPMTSLAGVDAYQNNVDMLASRTLMGKFLFEDAGIVLHSVTGGEVRDDGSISNIITRWTLRVTAKVLPWKPTARFSGISVYEVSPGGSEGVLVDHQTDYWDSINLRPGSGGEYQKVDKSIAVKDFLGQVKPENANAVAAGPEVPYQLLRRGDGYEVRRYPSYTLAKIPYDRRDEGYDILATITQGANPLAPSLQVVPNNDKEQKMMAWPLTFTAPGEANPAPVPKSVLDKVKESIWSVCEIETIPSKVVAVGTYSDASVAPIVRRTDKELREACTRDGIKIPAQSEGFVKFAQYDASTAWVNDGAKFGSSLRMVAIPGELP
eukprot:CAMPEP_0176033694 /NCGR_PEP_ID=MMETSP0120_2-20121206/16645_1 /TAXON_ID=160619 /ORGANISM="Kryptoperidinium foliaceum, Strain CCMP 1326" /LENGTH=422 /DNA_ID=CAMNT_0017367023 /DNA_START=146 /DNA_END=1412 /DNA_ORIENTATION=+